MKRALYKFVIIIIIIIIIIIVIIINKAIKFNYITSHQFLVIF